MLIQPGSASLNAPVLLAVQPRPTGGELQPAGQLPLVVASPSSGPLVPYRAPSAPPPSVYGGIRNHGVQQYLPVGNKRELTPREQTEIEKKSSRWFPKIGAGYSTPMTELLSSPAKGATFWGALTGAIPFLWLQAAANTQAHASGGAAVASTLIGAISALFGGITSFISRRQHNENIVDLMQRLPEGATKRDMMSDPVYQADLNRVAMQHSNNANNMMAGMMMASAFNNNSRR